MVDWKMAIKIACGGFGMVFIILAILYLSVWMTKSVVDKIVRGKPEEKNRAEGP